MPGFPLFQTRLVNSGRMGHVNAIRSLSDGSSFQYDANGNMTQRTEMSGTQLVTYQQQWDIDNRLVVITNTNTGQVTRYFYDADGNRAKRISPQGTTVYLNADYEVTGPSQMVMPTVLPTYTYKLYFPTANFRRKYRGAALVCGRTPHAFTAGLH